MPKLPIVKPKKIISVLEKADFVLIRKKSSHMQYKKGNLLVTVPEHNKDLNPTTLKSILRQAKITVKELIELL